MEFPKQSDEIEKLLEIASAPLKPGEKIEEVDIVQSWVLRKGVKTGDKLIRGTHLWLEFNKDIPNAGLSRFQFYAKFAKCFPNSITSHRKQRHYYLDGSVFDTSDEMLAKVAEDIRNEYEKRLPRDKKE